MHTLHTFHKHKMIKREACFDSISKLANSSHTVFMAKLMYKELPCSSG